jgi:hypothetical protein
MKTKVAFLTILAVAAGSCALAQSTEEYDDMYFTAKDRATLTANRQVELSSESARRITESETASVINPTDSYSARNVNPEYISGVKTNGSSSAVQYFSPSYQPMAVNQKLTANCNTCGNDSYGNATNFNTFNQFSNPYGFNNYGMMNSYNGFGNGFYQPGLNFSFGNGWGGPSSSFYNNYYGMNSFGGWGNSFYNNSFGWGNGYYGNTVVVIREPQIQGRRPTRADASTSTYYQNRPTTASTGQTTYYDRGWRQTTSSATPDRGSWTNSNNGSNTNSRQSNWGNQSPWGTDGGGSRNSSISNGNSGGSRSSGFSGSGSGTSGGRRGRD